MKLEITEQKQKNKKRIYTLLRNGFPVVQSTNIKHILEDKQKIKKFGYLPTIFELYNLYTEGSLKLTDQEENELIKQYNQQLNNTKK